jgi:hypothetical protein
MDEHIIEIDQIEGCHVVLVVPSLRLIVMGRTLEEARTWARSAIGWRGLSAGQRAGRRLEIMTSGGPRARTRPDDRRLHHPTPTTQPLKPTSPYSRDQVR